MTSEPDLERGKQPRPARRRRSIWPPGPGAFLAALIAVAAAIPAWWIIRSTVGDLLVGHDPEVALRLTPRDPRTLLAAAGRDLSKDPPRGAAASRRLRTALIGEPLNAEIYADLGLTALLRDDGPLADRLFAIAAGRSRRVAAVDLWALDRAIEAGDFGGACEALDIVLRTQPPEILKVVAEKVADLSDSPGAWAPLTRLLANNPPWRSGLLEFMSASPATADAVEPILDRLAGTAHPAVEAEVAGVLAAMIAQGDYRRADATWRRLLPSEHSVTSGFLNNGRFRINAGHTPFFAWTPAPDAGGAAILGGLPEGTGLRVILTDRTEQAPLISQLLVAPPGQYVLAGKVRAPDRSIARDIGLTWMLVCAGTRQRLGETPALYGDNSWRSIVMPVNVPGQACSGQWLELHRRGSLTGMADGAAIWFDQFSLAPRSAAAG